jgi:hypothetical protein
MPFAMGIIVIAVSYAFAFLQVLAWIDNDCLKITIIFIIRRK